MGTDINCWVERRIDGRWQVVTDVNDDSGRARSLNVFEGAERDGSLFAIVAGLGAAEHGVTPICPLRGFPADSPHAPPAGFRETATCHDVTWLTLREIVEFPWEDTLSRERCYVDADSFLRMQIEGRPGKIRADAGSLRVVPAEEMQRRINSGLETRGLLTQVNIGVPYSELAGRFFTHGIGLLKLVGPIDDVRLIVWFDS